MKQLFLVKERYTVGEVSQLTGLTRRQLNTWDRNGFFSAAGWEPGQGRRAQRRYYSPTDLLQLQFVSFLRRAGLTPRRIRNVLRNMAYAGINLLEMLLDERDCHLVTDGDTISLYRSAAEVVDILKRPGQRLIWFAVADHFRRLSAEVEDSILERVAGKLRLTS
ncbi:MAG: MerR family transcriptional regulator [Acidobacteria bacterium]|nr:MerR family transcriptional regulator [Acidobacteriota bacterium]